MGKMRRTAVQKIVETFHPKIMSLSSSSRSASGCGDTEPSSGGTRLYDMLMIQAARSPRLVSLFPHVLDRRRRRRQSKVAELRPRMFS